MVKQLSILGPPGCGKTTTLTAIATQLLADEYTPAAICYTAFTRVAADVARDRAVMACGGSVEDYQWYGTIHSLCGRLLEFDWRERLLADNTAKGQSLLRTFGRARGYPFEFGRERDYDEEADLFTSSGAEGNRLLGWWNWARQCCYGLDEAIDRWQQVASAPLTPTRQQTFVADYEGLKAELGMEDFTDVLQHADAAEVCPPTHVLIVDEAQDLSPLQWRIIDRWRERAELVYLAGDDDQAIYGFQGGDARLFLERVHEGDTHSLGQSYRLPRSVHAISTWLATRIQERAEKPFAPRPAEGAVAERALFNVPFAQTPGSWFVLARNTRLLDSVRAYLEEHAIPYSSRRGFDPVRRYYPAAHAITDLSRGRSIRREDLQAVLHRLTMGKDYDPTQIGAERRMTRRIPEIVAPSRLIDLGFMPAFVDRMRGEQTPVRLLSGIVGRPANYLRTLQKRHGDDVFAQPPRIELGTIHSFKGDEADNVALLMDMAPASQRSLEHDPDSEHRVWYVGLTRARERLYLLTQQTTVAYMPLTSGGWRNTALGGSA